jgi:hypothetical protein
MWWQMTESGKVCRKKLYERHDSQCFLATKEHFNLFILVIPRLPLQQRGITPSAL